MESPLKDFIAIAAILSGAAGWNEIEQYGKVKQEWLKPFLRLPAGVPSRDTHRSPRSMSSNHKSAITGGHGGAGCCKLFAGIICRRLEQSLVYR